MKNGFETSKGDGRGINLTTKSDWNGYSNRRQISLRDKEAHLDIHGVFLGQSPELDKLLEREHSFSRGDLCTGSCFGGCQTTLTTSVHLSSSNRAETFYRQHRDSSIWPIPSVYPSHPTLDLAFMISHWRNITFFQLLSCSLSLCLP